MNKYSISFKYLDLQSKGHKYITASSEAEAILKFKELYKDYSTEITKIKIIKKKVEDPNQ